MLFFYSNTSPPPPSSAKSETDSTKNRLVRIISQETSASKLVKDHNSAVCDLSFFEAPSSDLTAPRRFASVSVNGSIYICNLQDTTDDASGKDAIS